jgi:glucose-1-phosphate adenylyltransferase
MTLRDPSILALIMAGGAGTRMAPLTDHRAKPAMPYAGVYRLVDFPLSNCAHSAITDVWVLQQFQPHALGEHLAGGRPWDLDRTRGGLQASGEVSPRVPLLMAIRDKLALALREES